MDRPGTPTQPSGTPPGLRGSAQSRRGSPPSAHGRHRRHRERARGIHRGQRQRRRPPSPRGGGRGRRCGAPPHTGPPGGAYRNPRRVSPQARPRRTPPLPAGAGRSVGAPLEGGLSCTRRRGAGFGVCVRAAGAGRWRRNPPSAANNHWRTAVAVRLRRLPLPNNWYAAPIYLVHGALALSPGVVLAPWRHGGRVCVPRDALTHSTTGGGRGGNRRSRRVPVGTRLGERRHESFPA